MALLVLHAAGCGAAPYDGASTPVVRGPLPTRTQHPLALTLLALPPRRAATQPEGSDGQLVSLAWSSLFERSSIPGQSVQIDGEIGRAAWRWRHGLGPDTDIEGTAALLYASSGFLDRFVEEFHEATGLPGAGRSLSQDDQFEMSLRRNGQQVLAVEEDRLSLGDTAFVLTRRLRREDARGAAVAVRVGVELPTGSRRRGFGNGEVDWGAGLLLERSLGRLTMTGGVDWIHPERADSFVGSGVRLRELVSIKSGWEYRLDARTSLLLQLDWTSPMTRDFDLEEIDRETFDLGLGFACDLGSGARWMFSLHEDLVAATGPDFGLFSALAWGF